MKKILHITITSLFLLTAGTIQISAADTCSNACSGKFLRCTEVLMNRGQKITGKKKTQVVKGCENGCKKHKTKALNVLKNVNTSSRTSCTKGLNKLIAVFKQKGQ
ncbi:MAG: Cys-rich protein [Spirochaetota bacterium]